MRNAIGVNGNPMTRLERRKQDCACGQLAMVPSAPNAFSGSAMERAGEPARSAPHYA
jgi:hypothetical protein